MSMLQAHAGLAGKNAVLVGGATGIGRSIALKLAEAGVNIASCDNDVEGVAAIVPEVQAFGVRILSAHADVRDVAAFDAFFDEVETAFEQVDIVVNIAGGTNRGAFVDTTRAYDAEMIRLNYGYVLDSTRRMVPLIRKGARGGVIINFTTIEAHRGAAGYSVYAGAKAAVTNFTRAMAVELGKERIRVNIIAPDTSPSQAYARRKGAEEGRMARYNALSEDARAQAWKMYIPMQEPPGLEDLANAVLFLASDLARTITGQVLHVDGGTSASLGFIDWPFGDGHGPSAAPETLHRLFGDE
jgi:NAD(P)-dependent dehydrogenase (short-subunit alcohol dehydrogenase family)